MSACNCCSKPPCGFDFECQSKAGSKSKPGPPACAKPEYEGYVSDPRKYYLKKTSSYTSSESAIGANPGITFGTNSEVPHSKCTRELSWDLTEICDPVTGVSTFSGTRTVTVLTEGYTEYFSGGVSTGTSPTVTATQTQTDAADPSSGAFPPFTNPMLGEKLFGCLGQQPISPTPSSATEATWNYESHTDITEDLYYPGPGGTYYGTFEIHWHKTDSYTETISEEWSAQETSELIAQTLALLDGWESVGSACAAARDLSEDENTFSAQKFRWRIIHAPTGTCYLKVWMKVTTTPDEGDPSEEIVVYEWTGSGSPCFPDQEKPPDHADNRINGPWNEVAPPSVNGEVGISILKFSCVEGYEPGEGEEGDGFPMAA